MGSHGHAAKGCSDKIFRAKAGGARDAWGSIRAKKARRDKRVETGVQSIVRDGTLIRKPLVALLLLAPVVAGCSGGGGWGSDIFSKDADWFSRSGRVFIRNISIETPPLTPTKPVTAEDMVSADGGCPGMAPAAGPANANALADGAAGAPPPQNAGSVALGHTECDVVRGIGAPDNVNLSNNPRGDRVAVITYRQGPRAGIYTFTAGRLSSIERGEEPAPQPKAGKSRARKPPAT
jgi:hypothetical protein